LPPDKKYRPLMTSRLPKHLVFFWFFAVLMLAGAPLAVSSTPTVFVDCDGDGFDDNSPDDDADGIPDEFERHGFTSAGVSSLTVSQMFTADPRITPLTHLSCSAGFGMRKFMTRAVCESRLDFDSGFGSSLGLSGGLGSGGGCAGGVCF